jgi:cytochrome o ubiquinol oxidase subunit 1
MLAAGVGILVLCVALVCQIIQIVVSIRGRAELRDLTGDPWNGRSIEWSTASPPPPFNYAVLPNVEGEEPYWHIKRRAIETQQMAAERDYRPIEMPRNSPTGFVSAFFCTVTGFALIWHIWWMVGIGLAGAYAVFVWFAWRDREDYVIPAEEVARADRARRHVRAEWLEQDAREDRLTSHAHAGEPA